jgi:hypothetical protein
MGAAYDRDGNILGEVEAATKSEVFEKLNREFQSAAEIRIREIEGSPTTAPAQPSDRMLQFFVFDHLPPHLAAVSGSFCQLAHEIVATLPSNPERTVALRKLLEAKDCAVRALLYKG